MKAKHVDKLFPEDKKTAKSINCQKKLKEQYKITIALSTNVRRHPHCKTHI